MSATKNFLVITSIFPPTEAVKEFAKRQDWQLIVVGDKKTPPDWQYEGVIYLGPDKQLEMGYALAKELPWNHYCRKMIGYLYAIQHGADLIFDTDDDNLPLANWPNLPETNSFKTLSNTKFVNIYKHYTKAKIWPRGYPLNRLLSDEQPNTSNSQPKVGVWQFLANEDPDVDAIYRLIDNTPVNFDDGPHLVLDKGTACPFNSQNTAFHKDLFPLLYLPAFVTFRFTDILRGLVAQPLLWQLDYRLGFGPATVIQKRNPHDYLLDFESEVPVYLHSEKALDIVSSSIKATDTQDLLELLTVAYQGLHDNDLVSDQEIKLLKAWASDLRSLLGG